MSASSDLPRLPADESGTSGVMTRPRNRTGDRSRWAAGIPRPVAALWLTPLLLILGAGPPEVVRVRVPQDKVDAWFPRGSELRGMSLPDVGTLVADARA